MRSLIRALYRAQDKYPSSARELRDERERQRDSRSGSAGGDEFGHHCFLKRKS
jgi:hypothetical protein